MKMKLIHLQTWLPWLWILTASSGGWQVNSKVETSLHVSTLQLVMTAIGAEMYIHWQYTINREHTITILSRGVGNGSSLICRTTRTQTWCQVFGDCIPVHDGKTINYWQLADRKQSMWVKSQLVTSYVSLLTWKFTKNFQLALSLCSNSTLPSNDFRRPTHRNPSLLVVGTMCGSLTIYRTANCKQAPFDLCDLQPLIILIAHQGTLVLPLFPAVNSPSVLIYTVLGQAASFRDYDGSSCLQTNISYITCLDRNSVLLGNWW